jgi:hypothetical protein
VKESAERVYDVKEGWMGDSEIKFSIERRIGVLSEGSRGWKKELNLVSWNDREAKLDLRDWSEDHLKMGKGLTLTRDEAVALRGLLTEYLKA